MKEKISRYFLVLLAPIVLWKLFVLESQSLYHPDIASYHDPMEVIARLPIHTIIQEVYFNASDGIRLNGWYIAAHKDKPTIVFAHGNGGNLGDRWYILKTFADKGYGILAFDYRGYGKSSGTPQEKGLYLDMEAASRLLVEKGIPFSKQIAMGESLGGGVAVDVATRTPFRAVILYSTFTSTPDVAGYLRDKNGLGFLGFVPLKQVMQQHFDSLSKIALIKSPLLIMHGQNDEMMPISMPQALYTKASVGVKKLLIIPNSSHNTVLSDGKETLFTVLEDMLAKTGTANISLQPLNGDANASTICQAGSRV